MQCQECGKRPATLHFTKIVNGEKTEFHICEACAREKGEMIPGTTGGFSIHNLLSGLMDFHPGIQGHPSAAKQNENIRCEECGLTYSQFSKIGRFGCSSCYKYFNDRLDPLFKRVHGNTVHVGKVPKRAGSHIQVQRKLDDLRRELQYRIVQEEFEEAAALRDQIRELEKNIPAE
ncbi:MULTISPECIES: UvrB/UvrC motif-containing protein [Paenibacillus]|uniref:Protein-arginine kinase activator protein n=1 Tax=Paenibacillus vini TaxID=1476024 RepID=A0ABQ4MIB5_9BACL|nr:MULTISPECIES: UvrB/UvrC motif-containing protein [Paenibacillus]MBQ4901687.1 UvrB/UvrC motif-containing protein [Paenibacillus sp. Marseille-P2973]MDN4069163.1 UvrB/UvrC motif-containing protein [Paenibacillus vini]GIP55721.1 protein-arginine kinase activator protein [Paenibacillus vini]